MKAMFTVYFLTASFWHPLNKSPISHEHRHVFPTQTGPSSSTNFRLRSLHKLLSLLLSKPQVKTLQDFCED